MYLADFDTCSRLRHWAFRAVCLLALLGAGCAPAIPQTYGKKVQETQFERIVPGLTTRADILGMFGMPMYIIAMDEAPLIREGSIWKDSTIKRLPPYRRRAETFFEIFRDGNELNERSRLYYYHYTYSSQMGYFMLFYIHEIPRVSFRHLWVLVDEETGMVEDAFFQLMDRPGRWASWDAKPAVPDNRNIPAAGGSPP